MNMKRFMNKKVVAIGLAAGITLGGAGAAFAYFTAHGNGTGSASTGSVRHVDRVQLPSRAAGRSSRARASETITYTVTNGSNGDQALSTR